MTYDTFKQEVLAELQNLMGSEFDISTKEILKNNNLRLDGLIMSQSGLNISPTIYLNYYYDMYQQNTYDFHEIVQQIVNCYEENKMDEDFDIESFTDYNQVKDHIVYRLINLNQNQELLEGIPFVPYLDLAIIFYYSIPENNLTNAYFQGATASIQINNEHLEMWNVTVKDIYAQAKRNTHKMFPAVVKPIAEVLKKFLTNGDWDLDYDSLLPLKLYVLSNSIKCHGATALLYQNQLQKCADELDQDLIIIPSSIHEIIYLPASAVDDMEYVTQMIHNVNETEVSVDEILSDHPYFYSRETHKLSCA